MAANPTCPADAARALTELDCPYQVVEMVFSQMLACPADLNSMFYSHVLVELCMAQPQKFPEAVEDGLDRLLELNVDLDLSLRLTNWLITHLTAFNLDWPWAKWVKWHELSPNTQRFIKQTLQQLENLMAKESAFDVIPLEIVTPALDSHSRIIHQEPNEAVLNKLKAKPTPDEMLQFASEVFPEVKARVEPLVVAALHLGRVSFTHLRLALERIAPALVNEDLSDQYLDVIYSHLTGNWAAFATGVGVDTNILTKMNSLRWLLTEVGLLSFLV